MTLSAIFWAASLPSTLGVMPYAPQVAVLEDVTYAELSAGGSAGVATISRWFSSQPATYPEAGTPAPARAAAIAPALSPDATLVAITPLQGMVTEPLQSLGKTVDWQRWHHLAAVTVVATQPLADEDGAIPASLSDTLATGACPVAQAHGATTEDSPRESPADPAYVIRVKGVAIGQVASAAVADQVATDLRATMPTLADAPYDLVPALRGDTGRGMIAGATIFTLPPEAIGDDDSMALTTAQWVNNLRLALGSDPLNLSQVQRVAYGLDATSTQFQGTASWYGPYFHGRKTATGEIFDQEALTAAHKTLPFNTYLEVRNLLNGKTVVVRINDRGPYVGDRSLDLSYGAARCLGSDQVGVIPYEATILTPDAPPAWEEAAFPL